MAPLRHSEQYVIPLCLADESRRVDFELQDAKPPRASCRLCDEPMNADKKTVDRHLDSKRHIRRIAQELDVEYKSLLPPHITCQQCGQR